ncbi:unnamed protein product [Prorocentrum cordatum]|uniref:Uncharacterized protein n=1 Tax=Prorocentrum cordatum TaxID=2364126 RepID=A0ABN9Q370_9DINO|nr:unnamed protein product [Polarella glacialis]
MGLAPAPGPGLGTLGRPHPSCSSSFPPREAMPPPPPPPPQRPGAVEQTPALNDASRYEAEAVRHEQNVQELAGTLTPGASPAHVSATLEAQIRELLESQENLRYELAQVKRQVGANSNNLEALQRSGPPTLPPSLDRPPMIPDGTPDSQATATFPAPAATDASPLSMYQPFYDQQPQLPAMQSYRPEVATQPAMRSLSSHRYPHVEDEPSGPPQPPANLYTSKPEDLLSTLHGHVKRAVTSALPQRAADGDDGEGGSQDILATMRGHAATIHGHATTLHGHVMRAFDGLPNMRSAP